MWTDNGHFIGGARTGCGLGCASPSGGLRCAGALGRFGRRKRFAGRSSFPTGRRAAVGLLHFHRWLKANGVPQVLSRLKNHFVISDK